MFTKRNIAKFVKDQIIVSVAASATCAAINTCVDEPTETQEIGIEAASLTVGYLAMLKLRSLTDRPIDAIANWRDNREVAETLPAV